MPYWQTQPCINEQINRSVWRDGKQYDGDVMPWRQRQMAVARERDQPFSLYHLCAGQPTPRPHRCRSPTPPPHHHGHRRAATSRRLMEHRTCLWWVVFVAGQSVAACVEEVVVVGWRRRHRRHHEEQRSGVPTVVEGRWNGPRSPTLHLLHASFSPHCPACSCTQSSGELSAWTRHFEAVAACMPDAHQV